MFIKISGLGIVVFGSLLIYIKRHLQDDSLLLGTGLILTGIFVFTIGLIVEMDSEEIIITRLGQTTQPNYFLVRQH